MEIKKQKKMFHLLALLNGKIELNLHAAITLNSLGYFLMKLHREIERKYEKQNEN